MKYHDFHSPAPDTNAGDPSPLTLRIVWICAHLMLVSSLLVLGLHLRTAEPPHDKVWQLLLAHFIGGRPGSAGAGIQLGFDPWFILYASLAHDFIVLLYLYPLLGAGYHQATRLGVIGEKLRTTHERALKHKDRITPYGAPGVFAFVVMPLPGTGPIVGMIVGYIIGLGTFATFGSVMGALVFSTFVWVWGYQWLAAYNQVLALGLLLFFAGAILLAGVGVRLYRRLSEP